MSVSAEMSFFRSNSEVKQRELIKLLKAEQDLQEETERQKQTFFWCFAAIKFSQEILVLNWRPLVFILKQSAVPMDNAQFMLSRLEWTFEQISTF